MRRKGKKGKRIKNRIHRRKTEKARRFRQKKSYRNVAPTAQEASISYSTKKGARILGSVKKKNLQKQGRAEGANDRSDEEPKPQGREKKKLGLEMTPGRRRNKRK